MAEFISYFFGQGETKEFHYFSLAHILPILFMIGIIALIIIYRKRLKEYKHESRIRLTLAFIMIITEMSYFWRLVGVESLNANPVDHLPITVCGWAIIFSSFLVLTKNQTLFDIVYFWVFAGSTFGLLTPTVITYCGPTRFRYYQFWLEHIMGFITLFYMMFVHGMRPNWKSLIKSLCAMFILGGIAIFANLNLPGANYLFMAMPEETASILDILPKNYVVRVIVMAVLISILFFVAYIPWLVKDIRTKKSMQLANVETPKEEILSDNTSTQDGNTSTPKLKIENTNKNYTPTLDNLKQDVDKLEKKTKTKSKKNSA